MRCPNCGVSNNDSDSACARCGKPLSAGTGQGRWTPSQAALDATDVAAGPGVSYSGFWRRFGAMVIDWLLLWVALTAISFVAGLAMATGATGGAAIAVTSTLISLAFWLVVPWLYFSLMESSAQQATLGKLAVGIRVTDLAGQRIGFGRATGRYWGKVISQMILYIGYLMAAFTERKQALHDLMAGTLVGYRNPSPAMLASAATARPMSGWVIALVILACLVPVMGILAAISIPAYKTYTLRVQVSQGLALADGLKVDVAERLAGTDGPIAATMASMAVDPVSSMYVSSVAIAAGAVIITYGNQADARLAGQTLALVPERDAKGGISWVCGQHRVHPGLEQGNPDPASLTTLSPRYLPVNCRP